MNKNDSDGSVNRRGLLKAGLSALAAGLLLKLVGTDKAMVERVYAADGSAVIIGGGNTGSSTTTLSSPVNNGPAAYFVNTGTGDAQAIQGNMTGTGRAFVGFASATSGSTIALDGVCNSPSGIALRGANTATSGNAIGVQGQTSSSTGTCIIGKGPTGEVFRVRGDGNVGIGTTSPSAPLHVKYASANTDKGTPAVIIDNPADGEQTVLQFSVDGSEMGRIRADKVGDIVVSTMANGSFFIRNQDLDTSNLIQVTPDVGTADGQTALLIRRNIGGTFTLQRVSMGATDSGGTGYRVLRVPN